LGKTSTTLLGMVVAEALAELDPLPSRVLPGTRIELQARLLEPSTHVELVLLGPRGAPRRVATELAGDRVSAVFYLDAVGTHLAQLMLDREGGPEPALEAWIGVGKALPEAPLTEFVPGEGATIGSSSPEARITAMLNAARRSEGISELRRHPELDRLARAHAQAMRRAGRLAHDLGNGNPIFRVQAASLAATTTGENLARASSLTRAHRAIWASPSHRANLLAAHFDSLGVGLARDAQGDWWLCQLLVDQR
jgi:uncharacterized protein YkwD